MDDVQEKAWMVVHFTDENMVEAVPGIWYIFGSNMCNWPPKRLRRYLPDLIKKREIPEEDWHAFPAKILGQYDDFQTAKRKVQKAQDTTDLSSNNENTKTVKRKRTRNLKYVSTDSENDLDSDENVYPAVPKKTVMLAKPIDDISHQYQSRINKELYNASSQSSQERYKSQKHLQQFDRIRSQADSPLSSRSETEDILSQESQQYRRAIRPETTSPKFQNNSRCSNSEPNLQMKEFQRQVLNQLNVISAKLSENTDNLQLLLRQKYNILEEEKEDILDDILHLFPLNADNQLDEVEEFLTVKTNMTALAKELSRMGGDSAKELAKKIMYRIMSNDLGQLFSWDGAKGKRPFKNLLLCQVILKAVASNQRTKHYDTDETIKAVKMWLVRAKDRMKNSLQKKQKRSNNQEEPAILPDMNNE